LGTLSENLIARTRTSAFGLSLATDLLASASPAAAQAQVPRIAGTRGVADYLNADCFVVCVAPPAGLEGLSRSTREAVEQHLEFARKLQIETRVLEGDSAAETLVILRGGTA
jgi:K+-sensing histidine kinase KdpD